MRRRNLTPFSRFARRKGSQMRGPRGHAEDEKFLQFEVEKLEARHLLTVASPPQFAVSAGERPIDIELARIDSNATLDLLAVGEDGQLLRALNGGDDRWSATEVIDLGLGPDPWN